MGTGPCPAMAPRILVTTTAIGWPGWWCTWARRTADTTTRTSRRGAGGAGTPDLHTPRSLEEEASDQEQRARPVLEREIPCD